VDVGLSQFLDILGCLDTPSAGQYLFKGAHVEVLSRDQRARLRRRFLGFVFQGFNLLARTSAQENVELPLLYRGDAAAARRTAATEALRKASGDVFGRIYEYFLAEFSKQGAHDGGEFSTPPSIVQTIVNVIEPDHGIVFDPACGSGAFPMGLLQKLIHVLHRLDLDNARWKAQNRKPFEARLAAAKQTT
jgi:hypothetical protein